MKLSAGIWILWGFCVLLCCFVGGWVVWQPNMSEAHDRDLNRVAADEQHAKEPQANTRVKKAVKEVQDELAVWQQIYSTKTPPMTVAAGGIDVSKDGAQLVVDSLHFRNSMQAAVNHQVKIGGAKLVSPGPHITDPGMSPSTILAQYYNYPAIPFPVVIFDFGTITVEGTYDQVMANVRAWKYMPNYLAVADGLRLQGTSPHIQGTYSLSIVGYIRGRKLFVTLPEIPGSASGGGGGGGGPSSSAPAPSGPATIGPGAGGEGPANARTMASAPPGGGSR